jgi:hypothetical protein
VWQFPGLAVNSEVSRRWGEAGIFAHLIWVEHRLTFDDGSAHLPVLKGLGVRYIARLDDRAL